MSRGFPTFRGVVCLRLFSLFLLLGPSVASAAAPPRDPGFEPIDPAWLREGTLTVRDANFAVSAPGPDWVWKMKTLPGPGPGPHLWFFCLNSGARVALTVAFVEPPGVTGLNAKLMDGFRDGFEKSNGNGTFTYQPSNSPIQGSYSWHHDGAIPNTSFVHAAGALCWTGKVVQLMAFYSGDSEPKEFRPFLDSFRTLKPVPVPAVLDTSRISPAPYIFLMLCVLLVGAILNRSARFSGRLNIWRGAGYALLVALIVHIGTIVASSSFQQIRNPGLQGEIVGAVVGSALVAFGIVFVGSILRQRKLAQNAAPPSANP